MLAYIKGTLLNYTSDGAIIQVGDIGYSVIGNWLKQTKLGTVIEIYTYHYLENKTIPRLLGVQTPEGRALVISLLNVSGVGPKMAGRILDVLTPQALLSAITTGDLTTLGSVKGLGKKTAQKIILELGKTLVLDTSYDSPYSQALLSLGFTKREIDQALKKTDLSGLSESQSLSALMRNLGSSSYD